MNVGVPEEQRNGFHGAQDERGDSHTRVITVRFLDAKGSPLSLRALNKNIHTPPVQTAAFVDLGSRDVEQSLLPLD